MDNPLENNLTAVRERIVGACERAGRSPQDVTLIAVSKTRSPDDVRAVAGLGIDTFGESRVQEALQKIDGCPSHLHWHFIGHLQRNKVRPTVAVFDVIHSVDSLALLQALDAAAGEQGRQPSICLQVNVAGEASKFGVSPDDLPVLADAAAACHHLRWIGLMTIPPAVRDPGDVRPFFRCLRELRQICYDRTGIEALGLSMGMSHDFEVAIEEGATWVRVGTAIFGRRQS